MHIYKVTLRNVAAIKPREIAEEIAIVRPEVRWSSSPGAERESKRGARVWPPIRTGGCVAA